MVGVGGVLHGVADSYIQTYVELVDKTPVLLLPKG